MGVSYAHHCSSHCLAGCTTLFLEDFIFNDVTACVGYIHTYECECLQRPEAQDPLDLDSQAVGNQPMWMLSNLGPRKGKCTLSSAEPVLRHLVYNT